MMRTELFREYTKEWYLDHIGTIKAKANFSTNKMTYDLYTKDGQMLSLLPLGIPKEIENDSRKITRYLNQSDVHVVQGSDGIYSMHVRPKMSGGGCIEFNPLSPKTLWPNGHMPVVVDCESFENSYQALEDILDAFNEWASKTKFKFTLYLENLSSDHLALVDKHLFTKGLDIIYHHPDAGYVRLDSMKCRSVPLKNPPVFVDYVKIQKYTPSCSIDAKRDVKDECNVCQSFVGRQGGEQLISCKLGDSFDTLSLMHEIGHAIGFYHEQQRDDRNKNVAVSPDISANDPNYGIKFGNSKKSIGHYDFKTPMHYHFFDDEKMKIRLNLPKQQSNDVTAMGHGEVKHLKEADAAKFIEGVDAKSMANIKVAEGVFLVGKIAQLSEDAIKAANFLADHAICPKAHARLMQSKGQSQAAVEWYVFANEVHRMQYGTNDWECFYQGAKEQIKLGIYDDAKENLDILIKRCQDLKMINCANQLLKKVILGMSDFKSYGQYKK